MEIKHTPAPWKVILSPTQIVTNDKVIANINKVCSDFGESQANARLIAAAPELLEALEAVLDGGYIDYGFQSVIDKVKNAIKQAKGK